MEIIGSTITELYVKALQALYDSPERESRLGKTKEILDVSMILKNPRTRHIIEPLRKQSLEYIAHEIRWYMSGKYEIDDIAERAKFWYQVADPEDFRVYSNYGAKLFHEKVRGYTQFDRVINEFGKNPYTRRGIFFFSLYPVDYIWMSSAADFVCTVYGHVIRNHDDRLDMYIYMRSNDINWGWGNDVPFFTLVQEMFATELGLELGEYHHHCGSLHIYEKFYQKLEGRTFKNFDIDKETPFEKLSKKDVYYLKTQYYGDYTPFMSSFTRHLSGPQTEKRIEFS